MGLPQGMSLGTKIELFSLRIAFHTLYKAQYAVFFLKNSKDFVKIMFDKLNKTLYNI